MAPFQLRLETGLAGVNGSKEHQPVGRALHVSGHELVRDMPARGGGLKAEDDRHVGGARGFEMAFANIAPRRRVHAAALKSARSRGPKSGSGRNTWVWTSTIIGLPWLILSARRFEPQFPLVAGAPVASLPSPGGCRARQIPTRPLACSSTAHPGGRVPGARESRHPPR